MNEKLIKKWKKLCERGIPSATDYQKITDEDTIAMQKIISGKQLTEENEHMDEIETCAEDIKKKLVELGKYSVPPSYINNFVDVVKNTVLHNEDLVERMVKGFNKIKDKINKETRFSSFMRDLHDERKISPKSWYTPFQMSVGDVKDSFDRMVRFKLYIPGNLFDFEVSSELKKYFQKEMEKAFSPKWKTDTDILNLGMLISFTVWLTFEREPPSDEDFDDWDNNNPLDRMN